jgi:hypothetical protein
MAKLQRIFESEIKECYSEELHSHNRSNRSKMGNFLPYKQYKKIENNPIFPCYIFNANGNLKGVI